MIDPNEICKSCELPDRVLFMYKDPHEPIWVVSAMYNNGEYEWKPYYEGNSLEEADECFKDKVRSTLLAGWLL